ncbi:hypothetical protein GURASL_14320 [Geotalea uraniireducens]|uniref:Uncharacterized protein n=2 Tax=Geotalea uraniireducens TaxID=351604 RepID=A0ABN6VR53_9BACT|nr:hypothetical protein GURASL_14320 [Geotalea uraniireducens]
MTGGGGDVPSCRIEPMKLYRRENSPLKRPFVTVGAVIGLLASGWYLYCDSQGTTLFGAAKAAEPAWKLAMNVLLIVFACSYVANLLRRYLELLRGAKRG